MPCGQPYDSHAPLAIRHSLHPTPDNRHIVPYSIVESRCSIRGNVWAPRTGNGFKEPREATVLGTDHPNTCNYTVPLSYDRYVGGPPVSEGRRTSSWDLGGSVRVVVTQIPHEAAVFRPDKTDSVEAFTCPVPGHRNI